MYMGKQRNILNPMDHLCWEVINLIAPPKRNRLGKGDVIFTATIINFVNFLRFLWYVDF